MILHPSVDEVLTRQNLLADAIRKGSVTQEVGRYAASGWVYVYKDQGSPSLAFSSTGNYFDGMSSDGALAYVVTTDDEDRDGDIVRPMGGLLHNYSKNPIVFFGHQEWEIPIGVCRSSDGRITVYPEENRMVDVVHFDLDDPDADFVYQKCRRKILNATSIAFVPVEAWRREGVQKARTHGGQETPAGWYFNSWDKTELSIVGVPSNPKAVGLQKDLNGACRDAYDKERGSMSPKLRKAWQPYCADTKGCWNGWCPTPGDEKDIGGGVVLKAVRKMVPEGPYVNPQGFATGKWYIVSDYRNGQEIYVVVREGQQRSEGIVNVTLRDARAWMMDNGFIKKSSVKSIEFDPEMDFVAEVRKVGEELAVSSDPAPMPGYGQIFRSPNNELWYVGGDGDEDGFADFVQEKLGKFGEVTYEAEGFPPKDEGWEQLYPKQKMWLKRKSLMSIPESEIGRSVHASDSEVHTQQEGTVKASCSCDDCVQGKACGCAKAVRQKSSYQHGGKTIETERVSSGWHWRVEGVGESSSPLPTEDQAVEAAQAAIGGKVKTKASDVACPRCKGEGTIKVSGQEQQCPRCNGAGVIFAVAKSIQADVEGPKVPGRDQNPEEKSSSVMKADTASDSRGRPIGVGTEVDTPYGPGTVTDIEVRMAGTVIQGRDTIVTVKLDSGKTMRFAETAIRVKSLRKALEQSDGRVGGYVVPAGSTQDQGTEFLDDPQPEGWAACETCHGDGNCGSCGGTGDFGGENCEECGGEGGCGACVGEGYTEKRLVRRKSTHKSERAYLVPEAGKYWVYDADSRRELKGPFDSRAAATEWALNNGYEMAKSVKQKQLDPPVENKPTAPQVLAALYSHAKAEAAYLDQLDEEYKDTLADYRRQQVEERMSMLKYQFSRAAGPDDDIEKLCKDFEDEHDKGMTSTGPDGTVEPGEAGLVEQGQIPEEKTDTDWCTECDGYGKLDVVGDPDPSGTKACSRCAGNGAAKSFKRIKTMKQKANTAYQEGVEAGKSEVGHWDDDLGPHPDDVSIRESAELDDIAPADVSEYIRGFKDGWRQAGGKAYASGQRKGRIVKRKAEQNQVPAEGAYTESDKGAAAELDSGAAPFNKAAPGTDEWVEEEATEPEHKEVVEDPISEETAPLEEKAGGGVCMCGADFADDGSCPSCGPVAEEKGPDKCPTCRGSGQIGDDEDCPDCNGEGFAVKIGPLTETVVDDTMRPVVDDKDSDPATEEILERYQQPKSKKWVTRKHLVPRALLKYMKYRKAANGRKYLVRAKQIEEDIPDDETKKLTTKLASAIDDLKSLVQSKGMPRELKIGLKHVADQIWYVGKALTDKGKEQKNGGSGSELSESGKEQRDGGKGSELKDKGEQQGKTPTKSLAPRRVSSAVERKLKETEAKLRRHGVLNGTV